MDRLDRRGARGARCINIGGNGGPRGRRGIHAWRALGSDENGCRGSEVRFQRSSEEVAGAVSNKVATGNPLQVRPTPLSIASHIIIAGVTTCVCGRPLQPPMIALALAGGQRHQVSERKRHPRQRLRPPRLEHHCQGPCRAHRGRARAQEQNDSVKTARSHCHIIQM